MPSLCPDGPSGFGGELRSCSEADWLTWLMNLFLFAKIYRNEERFFILEKWIEKCSSLECLVLNSRWRRAYPEQLRVVAVTVARRKHSNSSNNNNNNNNNNDDNNTNNNNNNTYIDDDNNNIKRQQQTTTTCCETNELWCWCCWRWKFIENMQHRTRLASLKSASCKKKKKKRTVVCLLLNNIIFVMWWWWCRWMHSFIQ